MRRLTRAALSACVVGAAVFAGASALNRGGGGDRCTTTLTSGASVSAALSRAVAGDEICLEAGTYRYAAATIRKPSATTVRAAEGVARSDVMVSTGVDVRSSSNLVFQGMTIAGAVIGTETATATRVAFVDIEWSDGVCVSLPGNDRDRGILIDRSDFPNVPHPGCGNEGRLQFNGRNTNHARGYHQGVTVRNSRFHGPASGSSCTDMIQINGDASGVDIVGNEFDSLKESACGRTHGDPIQFFGAAYTTLDRNYIHDSSTGLMNGDCNGNPVRITNNVFVDGGEITANTFRMTGSGGDVIDHNTIVDAPITFGTPNCTTDAKDETITNNVIAHGIVTLNGATYSGAVDRNLTTGAPAFAAGARPVTWAGFELASRSPGYHAAGDGRSVGIVP